MKGYHWVPGLGRAPRTGRSQSLCIAQKHINTSLSSLPLISTPCPCSLPTLDPSVAPPGGLHATHAHPLQVGSHLLLGALCAAPLLLEIFLI